MTVPLDNLRRIEQLEQQQAALDAELGGLAGRQARAKSERHVRLAVTCPDQDQSYPPAGANVFPIKFVDPYFTPNAAGSRTLTKPTRQATPQYAMNLRGQHVPLGTVVELLEQTGLGPAGAGHWFFEYTSTEAAEVVLFELFQPLAVKGSAAAFLLTYNALTNSYVSGELIAVHDTQFTSASGALEPYSDQFVGPMGCHGTAIFRSTDAQGLRHFNIIWMARLARFIYVQAYSPYDSVSNSIQCVVTAYWDQGYRPADQQTPITVYDPHQFFLRPDVDSEGLAVYRPDLNQYELVWLEQLCLHYTATLTVDMLGDDATIDTQSVLGMGWSLYFKQQDPFPATILNPRNHYGEKGDEVVIALHGGRSDEDLDAPYIYEILSVRQRPTWGFAKLNGTLNPMGSVTAVRWKDVAGTMQITNPAQNLLIHDRLLTEALEANTRITWEFDPIEKRYYLRSHACSKDNSSQGWGA